MGPYRYFYILSFLLLLPFCSNAQHITDDAGKTYYDNSQNKLKEVYSYKQVTIFNPRTSEGRKKKQVKHGPYFFYYKDGDIKISGRFKDGEKHGKWEYYSEEGDLTKVVKFEDGEEININKDPEQPSEKPKNREQIEKEMDGS